MRREGGLSSTLAPFSSRGESLPFPSRTRGRPPPPSPSLGQNVGRHWKSKSDPERRIKGKNFLFARRKRASFETFPPFFVVKKSFFLFGSKTGVSIGALCTVLSYLEKADCHCFFPRQWPPPISTSIVLLFSRTFGFPQKNNNICIQFGLSYYKTSDDVGTFFVFFSIPPPASTRMHITDATHVCLSRAYSLLSLPFFGGFFEGFCRVLTSAECKRSFF